MVKQEIYKINDFSTLAGWRKLFIGTSFSTHTGLHQSEKEIDKNYTIQPEHIVGKQKPLHHVFLNPSQKFQQQCIK